MLILKTLTYKNFQAVGDNSITIDLTKSHTTLIGGLNGAGKSTTIEALSYVLFGKSLKKVKLQGLINAINKKKMLVSIEFSKNGHSYKVIRGEKPKIFEIYKDNEMYNQTAASRDNQSQLEYILGFDYKLFTQILVLNKERYVPFMDSDAAARRKIVEDILDINIFSFASDITKKKIKESESIVSDLKFKISSTTDKISNLERLIKQTISNQDELVSIQEGIIANEMKSHDDAENAIKALKHTLDTKFCNLQTEFVELDKTRKEFNNLAIEFNSKINEFNKNKKFFENNNECPTCHQSISDELKKDKHDEFQSSIDEYTEAKIQCESKIESLSDGFKSIEEQTKEKNSIINEISNLNFQIKTAMNNATIAYNTIEKLNKVQPTDQYNEELEKLNILLKEVSDLYTAAIEEQELLKEIRDLLKDDGIKSTIINEYIDFINQKINEYLYNMDFYLNITFDNNFNDTIHSSQYDGFTYDNLSTGQKCRVNLAIWLSLLEVASIKNSISCNLLFLDELLEPIDADGVQLIMKLMNSKLVGKNIFVITQRFDEFRDSFESDILFKQVDDFTTFA